MGIRPLGVGEDPDLGGAQVLYWGPIAARGWPKAAR